MLKLVIGNQNFSSWSLRPWLALKHCGVPFETVVIPLDQPDTARLLTQHSPSGKVPVLHIAGAPSPVWDSLAICETLAERYPEKRLWPTDPGHRAWARAVANEMHSGFATLRARLPMKVKEHFPDFDSSVATEDLTRIKHVWTECRRAMAPRGPYLFGEFSIADAMYAPVVFRMRTYAVPLEGEVRAYVETMLAHPAMREWRAAAEAEGLRMARYE